MIEDPSGFFALERRAQNDNVGGDFVSGLKPGPISEARARAMILRGKSKRNYQGKARSRSLRDDSQKSKDKRNGKGRSRFPEGMTERKARAKAKEQRQERRSMLEFSVRPILVCCGGH